MSSITDSVAVFKERAQEVGLSSALIDVLEHKGVTNLAKLAFAAGQPGETPTDATLRDLVTSDGGDPSIIQLGTLASVRRLTFEAQTLMVAQVRNLVEQKEDEQGAELAPAERSDRIRKQKERLGGLELIGELECGHVCYDHVMKMVQNNAVSYLAPHKFISRRSELARSKPKKELTIDGASQVVVKSKTDDARCDTGDNLHLLQAFHRRALAMDLVGVASYKVVEAFHRFLMTQLQTSPPPGYAKISIAQVLQADQEAWLRLSEKTPNGIKRNADGRMPLDLEFPQLESDPRVAFHLLPLPAASSSVPAATRFGTQNTHNSGSKRSGKSGGKALKRKWKAPQGMPEALKGMQSQTASGKSICWAYNLPEGCDKCKAGQKCDRGLHLCMYPNCQKPHPLHKHENR